MLNLGFFELTLFGIIALIVLGPEKLPIAARTLGKWYGNIRRMSARLQSEFVSELQLTEVTDELKSELAKMRESEAKLKAQMAQLERSIQQSGQSVKISTDSGSTSPADTQLRQPQSVQNIDDQNDVALTTALNMPMANRWFLLGDYDKKRRLPAAPFMPNYQADPLLYAHATTPNINP